VLMFLYPMAITLMLLVIISPIFKQRREVYQATTNITLIAAVLDALNSAPAFIKDTAFVSTLLVKAGHYLALVTIGMGWV
ncbi:branched-chain amino acid transport system II carrier protein, partial [Enterococcus faecalis]|uniref:branched-chain amino acid transport system II carrier protein n=1 Tax=Enterococcus faecalis TaxID=1351 RepID=UPI003CC54381